MSNDRRRGLRREDEALWHEVIRSVRPLRARPKVPPLGPQSESPSMTTASPSSAAVVRPPAGPPPLAPLERRIKQRLARGSLALDRRIDLHGLTQAQAHAALLPFLLSAQNAGVKLVLIITGKGYEDRGVLRRQVPLWLRLPEFRACVLGFEAAHPTHGGEGAIYVRIRRDKRPGHRE